MRSAFHIRCQTLDHCRLKTAGLVEKAWVRGWGLQAQWAGTEQRAIEPSGVWAVKHHKDASRLSCSAAAVSAKRCGKQNSLKEDAVPFVYNWDDCTCHSSCWVPHKLDVCLRHVHIECSFLLLQNLPNALNKACLILWKGKFSYIPIFLLVHNFCVIPRLYLALAVYVHVQEVGCKVRGYQSQETSCVFWELYSYLSLHTQMWLLVFTLPFTLSASSWPHSSACPADLCSSKGGWIECESLLPKATGCRNAGAQPGLQSWGFAHHLLVSRHLPSLSLGLLLGDGTSWRLEGREYTFHKCHCYSFEKIYGSVICMLQWQTWLVWNWSWASVSGHVQTR